MRAALDADNNSSPADVGVRLSVNEEKGGNLSPVQKYDAPLDEETTSSLEALKAYSRND